VSLEKYMVMGSKWDLLDALNNHLLQLDCARFSTVDGFHIYDDVLKTSKKIIYKTIMLMLLIRTMQVR